PEKSRPGMWGKSSFPPYWPARIFQSAALTLAAWISTRTSPADGTGSGRSAYSRTSGGPKRRKQEAFMVDHNSGMTTRPLGRSGLRIAPLVFGANVFGWTVDQASASRLLDRFVDGGLNAIDTADVYSRWVTGNKGGESETMIGHWLKASPARRAQVVLITKVGAVPGPDGKGLSAKSIAAGVEASLRRLQTDRIDLYLSHKPDAATPIEETLRAYEALIQSGKVRAIGSSNSTAAVLRGALDTAAAKKLPRYEAEQPEYSLCERGKFEGPLRDLCMAEGLGVIVYYSLASGFLSGKYRSQADLKGARAGGA